MAILWVTKLVCVFQITLAIERISSIIKYQAEYDINKVGILNVYNHKDGIF